MFKTIVTASIMTVAITSSASACGFFTKAIYGGGCNQEEYEQIQIDRAIESGETVTVNSNNIVVVVDGVGTFFQKSELNQASKQARLDYIKERVGEEIAGHNLQEAFDRGEISEEQLNEGIANLDAGLSLDGFDDEGFNAATGEAIEGSIADQRITEALEAENDAFNDALAAADNALLDEFFENNNLDEGEWVEVYEGEVIVRDATGARTN